MARYVDAIDLPIPVEEAFDYLADFSRTAEWDPGVVEAHRRPALRALRERLAAAITEEHTPRASTKGAPRPSGVGRGATKATPEVQFDPSKEGAV